MLPIAIIAGGLGTRLGTLASSTPKALVPVAGEPFIAWQLRLLRSAGIVDVVLCVGHLGKMIEEYVGGGERFGCNVAYSYDGEQRIGTAGALAKALPLLGPQFFMTYGDSYLACDYHAIADAFASSGKSALMTVFRNEGALAPSNVLYRNGRLIAYEKEHPTPDMHHIDFGLSAFDRSALGDIPLDRATDLATVFRDRLAAGDLAGYEVLTRFYEVGTPDGIAQLETYLRSGRLPA